MTQQSADECCRCQCGKPIAEGQPLCPECLAKRRANEPLRAAARELLAALDTHATQRCVAQVEKLRKLVEEA